MTFVYIGVSVAATAFGFLMLAIAIDIIRNKEEAERFMYKVTAWMPLPEPYRGGDAE